MAKNVMKMLKPSPKRGKNAFDLSHRHILGANFGELLPITCIETVPGDYFEINCADLLRAMPMVTSPFMRAKQHLDFWFVPYTDLWHNFNSYITDKNQPQSAALKQFEAIPHINLQTIQTVINNNVSLGTKDIHGIDYKKGATKLFDLLGYGLFEASPSSQHTFPDVNLWRIAAYNYIWYNEYRQQYYDQGRRLLNAAQDGAHLFNFDDLDCNTYYAAGLELDTYCNERVTAMFQMRYRTWKKDLYTGILPSSQYGNVSSVSALQDTDGYVKVSNSISTTTGVLSGSRIAAQDNKLAVQNAGANSTLSTTGAVNTFDILALRNAQAVQIWRERALRSGNRVNDNMRGHFGEVPSYQRDHCPTYIGSYDSVLNVSDINATAQTGSGGNQSLGDIAGKGLSSLDSKKLKFNCNDFGVIMGIFSLLPEAEYNSDGIDRANQLIDRFDYFSPEMEDLGLEGVSSLNFMLTSTQNATVFGYAPRYFGYKTRVDKVFGQFKTGNPLQIWTSPKFDVRAALSTNYPAIALSTLYVNPKIFDVNFVADAETIGEQFLCDFFFDVEAVRPMTVLGLPLE